MNINRRRLISNFTDDFGRMFDKPGELGVKTITFIVTHQCNLRCTYCYEHHKCDERMTLDTSKKIVDFLFDQDLHNSEMINPENTAAIILDFIGGEPLLEIDLISDTVEYFLKKAIELDHRWATNYMISMSTNGVLGDDPRVQKFINKYDGRLSMSVTIDGDKESHDACRIDLNGKGSYDRAIKLYRQVNERERMTKYTIAPGNIDIFSSSVKHLIEDEGVELAFCNFVFEEGWELDHARKLYHQMKDLADYLIKKNIDTYVSILDWEAGYHLDDNDTGNWCGGNGKMLAFEPDGSIVPCVRFSKVSLGDSQPPYTIGNIDNGFKSTDDEKRLYGELMSITRQSQSTKECLDCPINGGCAWCTAYNYEITGTPNKRVTYICDMHKARILAQYYYFNKRHLEDPHNWDARRILCPKEWAIPIIGEDEYNMLLDLEAKVFEDATGDSNNE